MLTEWESDFLGVKYKMNKEYEQSIKYTES